MTAGALMGLTASAQWAVVGSYTSPDWNFEASTTFTGEGAEQTCEIAYLDTSFKIVDITNNNWDKAYGLANPLQVGVATALTLGGENIYFPEGVLGVTNAKLTWNTETFTLTVAGEPKLGNPTFYMTGSFNGWITPGQSGSIEGVEKDGVYTFQVNLGEGSDIMFKVASANWAKEVAGPTDGVVVGYEPVKVSNGGKDLHTTLNGQQTLILNYNDMEMWFAKEGDNEGEGGNEGEGEENTAVWAVVGSYTDPSWNFAASSILEGNGETLSCTIEYLTNDFKIVEISNNNWDTQYGTSTPLEINTPIVLDGKNGGADPSNMTFAGLIQAVKNAKVNWTPSTATLEIVAEESDLVIAYPTLYVTGSFCEWAAPATQGSVIMKETEGVYTATIDLGDSANVAFKLAGEGWSNEIAGGVEVGNQPVTVTKGGADLTTTLTGVQTLVFNYDNMTMCFEDAAAIESIENNNAPKEYFNLQGVKVANPQNGMFIIKQGNKTSKVVIR